MEGEIFDFDPINDQSTEQDMSERKSKNNNNNINDNTTSTSNKTNYSIVDMLEHEFADQERRERGEHDYNELKESKIFDYLDNANNNANNTKNETNLNTEDDDEFYDKYVPTDENIVNEYLNKLENSKENLDNNEIEENNLKFKYIERSNNDLNKIRFNKSIIGIYIPPENFARVCEGVYRSSFPRIENFQFLKSLKLKSILCLIPEEYPIENIKFNEKNDIKFYQIGLSGNKEPFVKIKPQLVTEAIKILINPENQPILIHCNRGKHRTGCIIGCIRKLQKWSHSMIFDEYRKFAFPKERPLDQQFIEMYNDEEVENFAIQNRLLPIQW